MKKRNAALVFALGIAAAMSMGALAEEAELTPGVTVTADENSKTGYTATFVYENAEAESVSVIGTFAFYAEGGKLGELPEEFTHAVDWEPGMFRGNNTDLACPEEMTKVEGTDYWTVSLPLPSGHYLYNYNVDGAEENIPDPANAPMASTAENGGVSPLSTFNVPYDEKQGGSPNFDFMLPQEGVPAGELTYTNYEDVNGNTAALAVYLPADYDAEREEPYNTLYLSHGFGGSEMEWFASGNTNYVFDNLTAAGSVEPTVVVTMNNTTYEWDFEQIVPNVMEHIIPFMEENYNVGTEPENRAFAGLSMGGVTTSNMYYTNADQFGYFGIFSGCNGGEDLTALDVEKLKSPVIMMGAGCYDFGNSMSMALGSGSPFGIEHLGVKLANLEIPFDAYTVKGGHDWIVWPQLVKILAENYLWK